MTKPVFQFLLVDHICMLLLFQGIFWEGQVLMLLYFIVDHLNDGSLVLEDCSSLSRIPPIVKLSFIAVFFRMVHNEKMFSSLVLEDCSSWSRIPPIVKLSFMAVFFRMVHNEKMLRRSSVNYRTFFRRSNLKWSICM